MNKTATPEPPSLTYRATEANFKTESDIFEPRRASGSWYPRGGCSQIVGFL
jgi:hypothetical protein